MSLEHWSWLLVLLAIADIGATYELVRAAIHLREPALEERAIISVVLTLAAMGSAMLAIAFLTHFVWPDGLGTAILIGILLAISLPQILWYAAYRQGRFR